MELEVNSQYIYPLCSYKAYMFRENQIHTTVVYIFIIMY